MMSPLDFAVEVAQSRYTGGSGEEWERAFAGRPLDKCRSVLASFPKSDNLKIYPQDFLRAWAREHPRDICPSCDGTGQVFDDYLDKWQQCSCPEGQVRPLAAGAVILRNRKLSDQTRTLGLEALAGILGKLRPEAEQALDEMRERRAS